jgi:hypothetical protein
MLKGLRIHKRLNLFKGVTLNISKTGPSLSLGKRGSTINLRPDGKTTGTVGLPGSGISYRRQMGNVLTSPLFWVIVALIAYWLIKGQ